MTRAVIPCRCSAQRHAPAGVRLGVDEDLGVHHALGGGPGEVGIGEVGEVLRPLEDGGQLVVEVQEGLQVRERVRAPQFVELGVPQARAVPGGEVERQLRLQGALEVQVQLGGGQRRDVVRSGHGPDVSAQRPA
jgi:hypothetical protein